MSDADRRRIRLNLDRARLLPGPWTRHIVVDAASSQLWYYQGGKQQGTMRVVTGMPDTQTPMLAGMVRYAILNPYWNVPPDLAQKRIAPKVLAGASLTAMKYEARSDWGAGATTIDPATIDWQAVTTRRRRN
jgi:murein L,D-transpeptidase YcbB/YkuD